TLVERKDAFVHNVAALRALVAPDWLPRIFFPYDRLLQHGQVVRDRVVHAEPKSVTLASGARIQADYLVLATGSTYPFPAKLDTDSTAEAQRRMRDAHDAVAAAE